MVEHPDYPPTIGAMYLGDNQCRFRVWAPKATSIDLLILGTNARTIPMRAIGVGYFESIEENIPPGTKYFYRIDGDRERPDPASRLQPDGVHAASAVVDSHFDWTDHHWSGLPLFRYITYELHIGTFTREGTFDAAIRRLDDLADLGITAIEIMPIAQFPGGRNWGYDGVHPFAVQNTYGGPAGLKRFVNAAHNKGFAVILDVVYNHLGPEGNYLSEFGPYFTSRHQTPWGWAMNFDDRGSDEVRRFFIENALFWINECHIDALRLDAVHAIVDCSARPFLQELASAVRLEGERLNRRTYTIAESNLGDPRLLASQSLGGSGIDAQWCDDFHHAIRTELTDERSAYYSDYRGFHDIVKSFADGFVQDGTYSGFRERRHGNSARHICPSRLVVCSQNHDQIGNRMLGERLTALVSFDQQKLAAATVLLSPYQPMLFMGEEYGETAPFQFFVSHSDADLIAGVRKGRKEEFAEFKWLGEPPDPQSESTFVASKLNHDIKKIGHHAVLLEYYKRLIHLRKEISALAFADRERMEIVDFNPIKAFSVRRWSAREEVLVLFHFGKERANVEVEFPRGDWKRIFDSSDEEWMGPGSEIPASVIVNQSDSSPQSIKMMPLSVVVFESSVSLL